MAGTMCLVWTAFHFQRHPASGPQIRQYAPMHVDQEYIYANHAMRKFSHIQPASPKQNACVNIYPNIS